MFGETTIHQLVLFGVPSVETHHYLLFSNNIIAFYDGRLVK